MNAVMTQRVTPAHEVVLRTTVENGDWVEVAMSPEETLEFAERLVAAACLAIYERGESPNVVPFTGVHKE